MKVSMSVQVDAIGDVCPLPVVKAKKALSQMKEGVLEVLVDNETSVHNLEKFAATKKCLVDVSVCEDGTFSVKMTKLPLGEEASKETPEETPCSGQVVVISSQMMGVGDDELGKTLMKGFLFALTQQDVLPSALLLYNGGVFLACEDSASLHDLKALEAAGVEVLSCGTCLANFDLTEKLMVGEVTNMYVIVEKQMYASSVLRP